MKFEMYNHIITMSAFISSFKLPKALYIHYYPDRPKGELENIPSFLGSIKTSSLLDAQCLAFGQYLYCLQSETPLTLVGSVQCLVYMHVHNFCMLG